MHEVRLERQEAWGSDFLPWATWWSGGAAYGPGLVDKFPAVPWKVLRAKARKLINRRLLDGCCCGCRGDFELTGAGVAAIGATV